MGKSNRKALLKKTSESFGFEWEKFPDIYESYEQNFLSYIDVDKEFFKGKSVLDAGCGAGRHCYYAAKYGARVTGFDISPKVVAIAEKNLGKSVRIMEHDIYKPLLTGVYDYILFIGVAHHLPDPEEGFRRLVKLLKTNGTISIWVYSKKDNLMARYLYEPLRKITTRIPHRILYYLCYLPAWLVEGCNRLNLPLFKYYGVFPFRTKLNDAFDVFSAPSAKYYDLETIQRWFETAGLRNIKVSYRMLNGKAKGIKGMGSL